MSNSKRRRRDRASHRSGESEFHVIMLIVTAVVSFLVWYLCALIFENTADMGFPLRVGLIYAVFFLILILSINITGLVTGSAKGDMLFVNEPKFYGFALGMVLVAFGVGALFQWLYQLGPKDSMPEMTSIVFVIDDSGSMNYSDSNALRYKAIDKVMDSVGDDIPYMIYNFSDSAQILRNMDLSSAGKNYKVNNEPNGGTAIRHTLSTVLDNHDENVWEGGEYPKVVLLTDGEATDIGLFSDVRAVLRKYVNAGISISTVGLGNTDVSLMHEIADRTGGVFVSVDDASQLVDAMKTASYGYAADRHLFGYRGFDKLNVLHGFMRILFLFIMGIFLGLLAAFATFDRDTFEKTFYINVIKAFIAAVLMEACLQWFDFSDKFQWHVLWLLFGLTFVWREQFKKYVSEPDDDPSKVIIGEGEDNSVNTKIIGDKRIHSNDKI